MVYHIMFYGGLILAIISIIISIFIFFKLNIKKVIGDLSSNTSTTIRKDYLAARLKKNEQSTDRIELMQDLEEDKQKQEYARKKARETFRGNGIYGAKTTGASLSGETQIIKEPSAVEKNTGFTVIEEATSLLSEEETEVLGNEEDTSLLDDVFISLEDTVVHHTNETMD